MSSHIRVSARGIIIHQNQILLNNFGKGEYYNIPGGGVEPGETIRQAVKREVLEESGLDVSVGEMIFTLEYEPHHSDFLYGERPQLSLVFACELIGNAEIQPPTIPDFDPKRPEIKSQAQWVPIDQLEQIHYLPYIHESLMHYLNTKEFSPRFIEEPLPQKA